MRPKHLKLTGPAQTIVYPVDWRQSQQGIAIQTKVTGIVTYAINYTVSDIYDPTITTIPWSSVIASTSADGAANLGGGAVNALQIVVTAGTGSVDVYINQSTNVNE